MRALIALVLIAGCGAGNDAGLDPGGDASPGPCGTMIEISPIAPFVGDRIRATAHAPGASGVPRYQWTVGQGTVPDVADANPVTFSTGGDPASIEFTATIADVYLVRLAVTGSAIACEVATQAVSVVARGDRAAFVRLRAVPPQRVVAPPIDRVISIGSSNLEVGSVILDPGTRMTTTVTGPAGGVPAYVRFSPNGTPDAAVEAFSDASGALATSLAIQLHSVLIVPSLPGLAPRRIPVWTPAAPTPLAVDAGTAVHGTVRDPDGAALAGATVQLAVDDVPSTVATTDAAGAFTVQVATTTGTTAVTVVPSAASGLPRLTASGALALAGPVDIRYASFARRSLAGVAIRRGGQPVARAKVVVVGLMPGAGTVTAGETASASGEVRIPITAGADGVLPAARAPAAPLSAVITVAPGDLAIAGLDLTAAAPATLDAAAMTAWTSQVRAPDGAPLAGAMIDVVPLGILALADAPALHLVSGADGGFGGRLPAAGRFDLRLRDPAARVAPRVVRDLLLTELHPSYDLPVAVMVSGTLQVGNAGPLGGGSIQILCSDCTGVERAKPIAEAAADEAGRFRLAVPAPGTM
jgi:hypothetical protein